VALLPLGFLLPWRLSLLLSDVDGRLATRPCRLNNRALPLQIHRYIDIPLTRHLRNKTLAQRDSFFGARMSCCANVLLRKCLLTGYFGHLELPSWKPFLILNLAYKGAEAEWGDGLRGLYLSVARYALYQIPQSKV
jgi:hypothetical protein